MGIFYALREKQEARNESQEEGYSFPETLGS